MTNPPDIPAFDSPAFFAGLVWLVGTGPGDPGLMTLQGLNAIRQADVIVHDALIDERILGWRKPSARVEFMGKRGGVPSPKQAEITARLIELSREGQKVLRLKGGDPFVFGRGGEEAEALVAAGVPFRVTPGITSGIGGLAYAGIPATHKDYNQAVTFLTGHDQKGLTPASVDWAALAKGGQFLVVYMGMKHLPEIAEKLIEGGRPASEPVAIVAQAANPDMRVLETTLATAPKDCADALMSPPAVICIGRNVELRRSLDWLTKLKGMA